MGESRPVCPFCGSTNVLPFEKDTGPDRENTFWVVFISAFLVIGFYFLFVILSYLSYPVMVIVMITLFSIYQRRKETRKNRPMEAGARDFLCIDCGQSFIHQIDAYPPDHSGGSFS